MMLGVGFLGWMFDYDGVGGEWEGEGRRGGERRG